jgi:HAD superfamily hydrolase (TIGR01549 family)
MKHIIFDFDGVLARSLEDDTKALIMLGTYPDLTPEQINHQTVESYQEIKYAKLISLGKTETDKKIAWCKEYAKCVLSYENTIYWEFVKAVKNIKNAKLAIVTSGSVYFIKVFVDRFEIEFNQILTIEDGISKEDKVEKACKNWKIDVKDCYYITDTVSDVLELRDLVGINKIYGCAWGWYGLERLRQVLPSNQIFVEFEDILNCF